LKVAELLSLASLISHEELATFAGLVDGGLERVRDEVEPAPRNVMTASAHVPRDLQEGSVWHVRAEELLRLARPPRLLSIAELLRQALLVQKRLRERAAEAVDGRYPNVALRTSACGQTTIVNVDANEGVAERVPERARERAARLAVENAVGINVSVRFSRNGFRCRLIRSRTLNVRDWLLIIIIFLRSGCGWRSVVVVRALEERLEGFSRSFVFASGLA
jgi:hypothetical protein